MSGVNDLKIPLFQYRDKDFNFTINKNNEVHSAFDSLLTQRWEQAEKSGILPYIFNIQRQKTLEGKYGFFALLNPNRRTMRRKPQDIISVSQPFHPNFFNYTNISDHEILFDIGNGDGSDIVVANTDPIGKYHSLLLTERFKYHPQRVTKYSLKRAIDVVLLNCEISGNIWMFEQEISASCLRYLRTSFNSLGANATVNNLHWHLHYLKHQMLLEFIKVDRLRGPVFMLTEYPAKGFCLKLSSFPEHHVDSLISWTHFILEYLQESSIPHHIHITRAKENVHSHVYDDLRIYIWARKSSVGVESPYVFFPGAFALAGHVSIKSEQGYENLTENTVAEILNNITSDSFHVVRDNILAMNLDGKGLVI